MSSRYEYLKKHRAKRVAQGICRDCTNKVVFGLTMCNVCKERDKTHAKKVRIENKSKNICVACGVRKTELKKTTCTQCIENAKKCKSRKLFLYRSTHFNGAFGTTHTAKQLASLWRKQRGLCGLTGRKLTAENAEIDHIIPKARGGSHDLDNLRWLTKEVNRIKRDLKDSEFIQLCAEVMLKAQI